MKKSDYLTSPLVRLGGSNPPSLIQKSELIQIPTKISVGENSNVNKALSPPHELKWLYDIMSDD